jgi:hypothetical protein
MIYKLVDNRMVEVWPTGFGARRMPRQSANKFQIEKWAAFLSLPGNEEFIGYFNTRLDALEAAQRAYIISPHTEPKRPTHRGQQDIPIPDDVIDMVRAMRARKYPIRLIVDSLSAQGIKSPRTGEPFKTKVVMKMLLENAP